MSLRFSSICFAGLTLVALAGSAARWISTSSPRTATTTEHEIHYLGRSELDAPALLAAIGQAEPTTEAGAAERFELTIEGLLRRAKLEPRLVHYSLCAGRAILRTSPRDGAPQVIDLSSELGAGFFVAADEHGRAERILCPASTSSLCLSVARGLASTLQWSTAPTPACASWSTSEPSPLGMQTMVYSRLADGRIERRRTAIPRPAAVEGELDFDYRLKPSGTLVATLSESGPWAEIVAEERIDVLLRGKEIGSTCESLRIGPGSPMSAPEEILEALHSEFARRSGESLPILEQLDPELELAALRTTLGSADLASLEQELDRLPAEGDARMGRLRRRLSALLTLQPEHTERIAHRLETADAEGWAFQIVVDALAATETAIAWEHLLGQLRTARSIHALESLIHAIATRSQPTREQAQQVLALAEQRTDMPHAIWLAVGALAGKLAPEDASAIANVLFIRIASAAESERQHLMLALGNARAAGQLLALESELEHFSTEVRCTFARALVAIPGGVSALRRLLESDASATVREEAALALSELELTEEEWRALLVRLEQERASDVRAPLLRALWRTPADSQRLAELTQELANGGPEDELTRVAREILNRRDG